VRMNVPDHHVPSLAGRNQATNHKPSVLCLVASVEQHQGAMIRSDRHAGQGILGSQHDPVAGRQGQRLYSPICFFPHGPVGVPWEDTCRVVKDERLSQVGRRQELEVESSLSRERGRQRLVELYGHAEAICLWLYLDAVAQSAVRVGAESGQLVFRRSSLAFFKVRNWIPLRGGRRQAYISIRADPLLMQDNLEPAHLLVAENVMISVVIQQHAQSMGRKIVLFVQSEIGTTE